MSFLRKGRARPERAARTRRVWNAGRPAVKAWLSHRYEAPQARITPSPRSDSGRGFAPGKAYEWDLLAPRTPVASMHGTGYLEHPGRRVDRPRDPGHRGARQAAALQRGNGVHAFGSGRAAGPEIRPQLDRATPKPAGAFEQARARPGRGPGGQAQALDEPGAKQRSRLSPGSRRKPLPQQAGRGARRPVPPLAGYLAAVAPRAS